MILIEEKIKLIIEKEVERLYDLSQSIGLTEEQVRALKVLYEIAKQQNPIDDSRDRAEPIKQVDILDLLKKVRNDRGSQDRGQSEESDD